MPLPTLSNSPRPRALGYGARIDDLLVRLAVGGDRQLTIQTAELEPPRINTAESPEDIRNTFGALFSRSGFSGGEGLDFAHQADLGENASSRYWDSRHIDTTADRPGQLESIELLREAERIEDSSDTGLGLAYDGSALYVAEDDMVRRSSNFAAASPVFVDDDPHAGDSAVTVQGLCAIGDRVYAALGSSGIHERDGSWSELSTFAAVDVWTANGILFASSGTVLASIALDTGDDTTLVTLPGGEAWTDLADAGGFIVASATDGYIYALGDDESGGLQITAQSPVGDESIPYSMAARYGFVFYATAIDTGDEVIVKWWRSVMTTGGVLDDFTLIRQFGIDGDGIDRTPTAMAIADNAVWLGVNESDGAHIWRYDLALAGRARWWDSGVTGVVEDLLFVEGEPYWSVASEGVYRRHPSNHESEGWIIGPLGDLFTASPKAWVGAFLDVVDVPDGRVELWYSTDPEAILDPDHASWVRLRRLTESNTGDTDETRIQAGESRFIAGMLRLHSSDDQSVAPSARGFTFRAYPGGNTELIVEMPVNVSDRIEMPGRRRLRVKGIGERVWGRLKGLEGTAVDVELFSPSERLRGVVEQVSTPVVALPRRGSPLVVTYVRVRGKRTVTLTRSESNSVWGGFVWGGAQWGGGSES